MSEEVKIVSSCCGADIDFTGGGWDGEVIVPIIELCKKCGEKCAVKRIVPEGYKELIATF